MIFEGLDDGVEILGRQKGVRGVTGCVRVALFKGGLSSRNLGGRFGLL